ncbi:hypothetical protein [Nostoc sp. UHCC 0251]|nr:hypothetical protein [Nostoc sp. UHCC 0251]MEA5621895.1 hypothetical protein [Nostoc sp. UHCC 0251]
MTEDRQIVREVVRGSRQLPVKESGISLKQKEEFSLKLQQFQSYERY